MSNILYEYRDGALHATESREVPLDETPAWWRATVEFVASIKLVPWFKPQGEPDPAQTFTQCSLQSNRHSYKL